MGNNRNTKTAYSIYGLTLFSEYPFESNLLRGSGFPEVEFTYRASAPFSLEFDHHSPTCVSYLCTKRGQIVWQFHRLNNCHVLHFTDVMTFFLFDDHIACHLRDPASSYLVEIHFLGVCLAIWLELQGILALHASSVVSENGIVAFLASNHGGKSSLAAALMQVGWPLLNDDLLALEMERDSFYGRPGYPQMRMWPVAAQEFLGCIRTLKRVHPHYSKRAIPIGEQGFGSFCAKRQQIACVYLPEIRSVTDQGEKVDIFPLSPRDAIIEFVRYSFVPRTVEVLGLQPGRLKFFSLMAAQVPVRRLLFPAGFKYLPLVRSAILSDLRT